MITAYSVGKTAGKREAYSSGFTEGQKYGEEQMIAEAVWNKKATYVGGGKYYWND